MGVALCSDIASERRVSESSVSSTSSDDEPTVKPSKHASRKPKYDDVLNDSTGKSSKHASRKPKYDDVLNDSTGKSSRHVLKKAPRKSDSSSDDDSDEPTVKPVVVHSKKAPRKSDSSSEEDSDEDEEKAGKYTVKGTLGSGVTAIVYRVVGSGGSEFALKRYTKGSSGSAELAAMKALSGKVGFPKLVEKVENGFVMELIGPSFVQIQRSLRKDKYTTALPMETVGSVGVQLMERMETMHSMGIVHGDLFRNNIAIGKGVDSDTLIVFDFGQVKAERRIFFDVRSAAFALCSLAGKESLLGRDFHSYNSSGHPLTKHGLDEDMYELLRYAKSLDSTSVVDYSQMKKWMHNLVEKAGHKYAGKIIWPPAAPPKKRSKKSSD